MGGCHVFGAFAPVSAQPENSLLSHLAEVLRLFAFYKNIFPLNRVKRYYNIKEDSVKQIIILLPLHKLKILC